MTGSRIAIARSDGEDGDVLELRGELDLTNAQALEDALGQTSSETVVVDLTRVTFLDSAGMRALDHAHRRFTDAGRRLRLVAPPGSAAAWTFRVAGFSEDLVLGSADGAASPAQEGVS